MYASWLGSVGGRLPTTRHPPEHEVAQCRWPLITLATQLIAAVALLMHSSCSPIFGHAQPPLATSATASAPAPGPNIQCRLLLTDSRGKALPVELLALLWPQLALQQAATTTPLPNAPDTMVHLQPGPATLWIRNHQPHSFAQLTQFAATHDSHEIRLPLPPGHRIVMLNLSPVPEQPYRLLVTHESGVAVDQPGNLTGAHLLMLPSGPCTTSILRTSLPASPTTAEGRHVVSDEPTQEWDWQIGG